MFGKEVSNGKWSDFGGGKEHQESPLQTACREGIEELNGFLGSKTKLLKQLRSQKTIMFQTKNKRYKTFLYLIDYDPLIPDYFNNNADFLIRNFPDIAKNKHNGYFEKKCVDWYDSDKLKKFTSF